MSSYLVAFSKADTLGVGTQKAIPMSFPLSSRMTFPTILVAPLDTGMMFWAAHSHHAIASERDHPQLLGHSDGMDLPNLLLIPSTMPNLL